MTELFLIENQTEEICLEAVKQDGFALRYIRNPDLRKKIRNMI